MINSNYQGSSLVSYKKEGETLKQLTVLEKRINFVFQNKDLLKQALTHQSYLNENRSSRMGQNERLEFLGDAVIELAVRDYLLKTFPEKDEGVLSMLQTAFVSTKSLASIAENLGIDEFLLSSRFGFGNNSERARVRIIGSAYEALAGAIYLDQGFGPAQMFLKETLLSRLPDILTDENLYRNPKSVFQEKAVAIFSIQPRYQVLDEKELNHEKVFIIGVYLGDELIAEGKGNSKKEAERNAAQAALDIKKWSVTALGSYEAIALPLSSEEDD